MLKPHFYRFTKSQKTTRFLPAKSSKANTFHCDKLDDSQLVSSIFTLCTFGRFTQNHLFVPIDRPLL